MTVTAVGLAAQMREGSQREHEQAESSEFMAALTEGRISADGYAAYLAVLVPIYRALERVAADIGDDPIAARVIDPVLFRSAALESDLAFWSQGRPRVADTPATRAYVAAIEACREHPVRYLAHHYTRYLGDLSGGQVIKTVLQRSFDLRHDGVAFYDFDIAKLKIYKDQYRDRLDTAPLDAAQQYEVVDAVREVFALNGAVFAELSLNLAGYLRTE